MRALRWLVAWIAAVLLLFIRKTCRLTIHDDPRPALRKTGRRYIYAILHAQQLAAAMSHGERLCGAMVSRSADGELLIPTCRLNRIEPVRGSTRKHGQDKGGKEALAQLIHFVASTGNPCTMAVDGPRGPRNHVHPGVAKIAKATDAAVLVSTIVPSRRWILSGTWDRMQIPRPFSSLEAWVTVVEPSQYADVEQLRCAIEHELAELERRRDPEEAQKGQEKSAQTSKQNCPNRRHASGCTAVASDPAIR